MLKSSKGTMEKSSFIFHVPSITCTPCTMSPMGLAGEFTAFMVPLSLVILRPRRLASSFEMKLWVTLESNNAQAACELLRSFFAPNPYGCGLCLFGPLPYFYLGWASCLWVRRNNRQVILHGNGVIKSLNAMPIEFLSDMSDFLGQRHTLSSFSVLLRTKWFRSSC